MSPVALNGSSPIDSAYTSGHTITKPTLGFGTRAIHVGSEANAETGAVIPPISLSTTYKQYGIGNHKVKFDRLCGCHRTDLANRRDSNILAQETQTGMHLSKLLLPWNRAELMASPSPPDQQPLRPYFNLLDLRHTWYQ